MIRGNESSHISAGRNMPGASWIWGVLCALVLSGGILAQEGPQLAEPEPSGEERPTGFFNEVVDVRVINVEVFVRDRSGVPVIGLGPEDFALEVDGVRMPISNFYAEAGGVARETLGRLEGRAETSFRSLEEVEQETPRRSYLVVLIDHQRLRAGNRKRAFAAIRDALERVGREDLIAVVGVESSLVFYSDFLYDREAVERILDRASRVAVANDVLEWERRRIFDELARGQSGGILAQSSQADQSQIQTRIQAYASQEYARSLESLRNIEKVIWTMAGVPGRKVLLYVGEGIPTRPGEGLYVEWRNRFGGGNPNAEIGLRRFDFNTDYERAVGRYDLTPAVDKLARVANRAGVTWYSIDAEDSHGGLVRSAMTEQGATSETLSVVDENYRAPLEQASKETGGRLLRSSGALADQLAQLVDDFDTYYSLGFTPPSDWEAGSDHDIRVEVEGRGFRVRHRASVGLQDAEQRDASATVAALMYQTADNPLDLRLTPGGKSVRDDGNAVVSTTLEVPVANLGLIPGAESLDGSLTIYVSAKSADGSRSQVQKIPFHLSIPNEVAEQAMKDLARYDLPLVLRPGDSQVAVGVSDNVSGQFSAVRIDVAELAPR